MMYTEPMRQNKDFRQCYNRGKSFVSRHLVIYARKNHLPVNRLGITTGKKVGNAVCRSRARRLIRQAWRENEILAPIGLDVVVVARPAILEISSDVLSDYFRQTGMSGLRKIYAGEKDQRPERAKKK